VLHGPRGTTTRTLDKGQACSHLMRMAAGMQKPGIAPGA